MTQTIDNVKPIATARRLSVGAEVLRGGGVSFRVWAPLHQAASIVFENNVLPCTSLVRKPDGYFSGFAPDARSGMRYRFRLGDGETLYPDPASRFQPDGPHGPSQIIDPTAFSWTDAAWPGITPNDQVIYEMHIGTFTAKGNWAAAQEELAELANLGITCIEVMPVSEFPGKFGWGYDGVCHFAPTHLYGSPDDFRRFNNHAHDLKMGVILDVVYNHFGPDGNYLKSFSADYFTKHYRTDWGEAINFDGENSQPVRDFFIANARYWIEEFHLDGFRFDATQNIYDSSPSHILADISRAARASAGRRCIILVNENEPQHTVLIRKTEQGGFGMDAIWNDDFHHSALVRLSGWRDSYLGGFSGHPQEFISMARFGTLYQGQCYDRNKHRRGSPTFGLPSTAFINFIENHDQVSNLARGLRSHQLTSLAQYRAMVALLLLGPGTPMLFQGQEFAASAPFHFFADHNPELAKLVRKGRAEYMSQFPGVATPAMREVLADPSAPQTFEQCRLKLNERAAPGHAEIYAMYRDLLRLRKIEPSLRGRWPGGLEGAVLGPEALALRFFAEGNDDRLLLINFGADVHLGAIAEPLIAPPLGKKWDIQWSSEDAKYLGHGIAPITCGEDWRLTAHAAVLLRPVASAPDSRDIRTYLEGQKVPVEKY
ncbi:MAG TPA: malto-oligosyltrehalose trehalohydrolase [Tepidisphaeraceae bacterium]|jgi:maltooligosyltrehalose trehalohydrolase|nr:malto-oligosyltrehalose trehalohydrolase [Tepidisphaeraceae bacterium]